MNDSHHESAATETSLFDMLYKMKQVFDFLRRMRGDRRSVNGVEVAMPYIAGKVISGRVERAQKIIRMPHTAIRLDVTLTEALGSIVDEKPDIILGRTQLFTLDAANVASEADYKSFKEFFCILLFSWIILSPQRKENVNSG